MNILEGMNIAEKILFFAGIPFAIIGLFYMIDVFGTYFKNMRKERGKKEDGSEDSGRDILDQIKTIAFVFIFCCYIAFCFSIRWRIE